MKRPPYAPGCSAKGQHEAPPHLDVAFPWIDQAPDMVKVITAFTVDCTPCMKRHREIAVQRPNLIHRALWLWLGSVAVTRVNMGLKPVATAADMTDSLFEALAVNPPSAQGAANPTYKVLQSIPLGEVISPEGDPANVWQQVDVEKAVEVLNPEHREVVWMDLLTLLAGWYQGMARARAEEEGRGA